MASISLTTGSIPKHIHNIALPMSIGFLFNTLYNVVDSYFAGQISTSALAAMALCFPVFFIILAASQGIARGASVLIANAIGAEDHEKEAALSGQVLSMGVLSSILLTGIGLSSATSLFKILGASGDYLELAINYIQPIFMGTIFFMLSSMSNSILLAHGDSKTFGKVLAAGFFLNLILDPWFLYGGMGLHAMGIAGIAWATVLIQALGGICLFAVLIRRGHVTISCCHHLKPDWKIYREILTQAVPTGFNMASIAVGFFVITYYLKFYGESAVAAFGVGTRIEQIALLPTIGLGAAIVSIVGQNNGAQKYDRVVQCVHLCIKYGFYLIVIASIFMYFLAAPLVRLFTDDPEVIELGTTYIRIMVFIQWAYVMSFIHIGFLQAVKKPMYGFFEAVVRKIVLPLGVFYIVVNRMESELNAFWFSIIAINAAVSMVTIIYAQSKLRKFCQ